MARAVTTQQRAFNTLVAWAIALLIAFPIIWTILTSFKPEPQAVASPPIWFGFDWTMRNYYDVQSQRNYFSYFLNSVIIAVGSTTLGLLIAVPAAWSMDFVPGRGTRDPRTAR